MFYFDFFYCKEEHFRFQSNEEHLTEYRGGNIGAEIPILLPQYGIYNELCEIMISCV